MADRDAHLHEVLDGYAKFLQDKDLALDKHQPYLVRWVRDFLHFARAHGGYSFEQTLDLFLAGVGGRVGTKPWQLQQASDAIRIYRDQYRGAKAEDDDGPSVPAFVDDAARLERLREVIRLRHYASSTEKTYLHWNRRFLAYRHDTEAEGEPTAADAKAFLTHLAMVEKVSASTQNQAFSALLLLFREVLHVDLEEMAQTVRAKRGPKLPTVMSVTEVQRLLSAVEPPFQLMVKLLYGSGLRLGELLRLRVKDLDFDGGLVVVRSGKGDKDRATLLPVTLCDELHAHLAKVRAWHEVDVANGYGEAPLPDALARKHPNAGREWGWQYVFPADKVAVDPADGKTRRYHVYDQDLQKAVRRAARKAGLAKPRHGCPDTPVKLKVSDIHQLYSPSEEVIEVIFRFGIYRKPVSFPGGVLKVRHDSEGNWSVVSGMYFPDESTTERWSGGLDQSMQDDSKGHDDSASVDTRLSGPYGFLTAKHSASLEDAVAAFNRIAAENEIGKTQKPLTAKEVIAAMRSWGERKECSEETRTVFQQIIETNELRPGDQLSFTSRRISEGHVFDVWEVRFGDGKGSTAWFKIRDVVLASRPKTPQELTLWSDYKDAVAEDGVVFSQGYTGGAVCSPTRAGIMIGGYSQRVGVYTASDGGKGFDPKKEIFPGYLPDDYVSSAIGKWHLGLDEDYPELKWHALNRGFDECYKFMGRGGHSYFNLRSDVKGKFMGAIYRNKERINDEGYMTTRLTEEAVAFIDRNKEKPFFLYLAYNAVHAPAEAPDGDIKTFQAKFPELSRERAVLMAMLKHLDDGVGDVVGKLKREGIFDNTLLFFLTDNGGSKSMSADNTPLRGFKQTLDEGGIRTPFIVSWPERFKGGRTVDTPIISFDILPTALDAVGATPAAHDFAGKSLLPLLTGESTQHHDTLFWSIGPDNEWAVRRGDWKLHWIKSRMELVNLAKDPSEKRNLADSNPEKVKELSLAFDEWIERMPDPIKGGPKRKDVIQKPVDVAGENKNMTPREIERARIRDEKRAAKKAAKEQEKAKEKVKEKSSDKDTPDSEASRPAIKSPVTNVAGPHPGGRFDLSHWKLTLPTSADNTYGGHPQEISAAALSDSFKDPYFYTDSSGAMVFWCPVVGATTEGTQFPRSELREMLQPGNPHKNWSFSGSHEMTALCRVLEIPSDPKVVIGQIHSYTGKSKPLVKLQYYKGRIEALVKESPTEGKDKKLTFPDVELGSDINWTIRLKGGVLAITVNGTTQEEHIVENDRAWADQTFYFKTGAYPQDNAGEVSEGARVSFSRLVVTHSDD